MDGNRFDELSRRLATGTSRRSIVTGAVSGLAGAIGLRLGADAQVSQAQCGNRMCKNNPGVCNDGCVCCVYSNGNNRCRPAGSCGPGVATCPPGEIAHPVRGCVAPPTTTTTTTVAPPATTTTTVAATTTTTTTTIAPCGPESTLCNGVCCASPCQCLVQTGGGLACANPTAPSPRGCTGTEGGRCDAGFACIAGQCQERCGSSAPPPSTTTTTLPPDTFTTPPPCLPNCTGVCGGAADGCGGVCPSPCGPGQSCCRGACSDAYVIDCFDTCVQCVDDRNACAGSCFRDLNGIPSCFC